MWDKSSLVSMNEARQFYVSDLQPFVNPSSTSGRERDTSQRLGIAEVQDETSTAAAAANVTLYGSTQLAVDLAALAAEAGNETSVGYDACSQIESTEAVMMANEHSEGKMLPAEVSIALDGFCLQSGSVSFVHVDTANCGIV